MLTAPAGRAARGAVVATLTVLVSLLATATPAAAHTVGGGDLPAPPWLLAYLGAALVLATAATLRATWPQHRLHGFGGDADAAGSAAVRRFAGVHPGHLLGLLALVLVLVAAVVGPDSSAANVAPVAVLVIWWVGVPVVALVAGDVMRAINPFVPLVALADRGGRRADDDAPAWTSAAFLGAFAWFFMAYHRPGSPRSLAVFLVLYALAAVAGGIRWGRDWLAAGEGFAGLSASVALLSPWRRRDGAPPPGVAALMIVWLGSTAFDAFTSTPFWADILGDSQGWSRTLFNTVGLVWITAIVAGAYLLALRLAERAAPPSGDDPVSDDPVGDDAADGAVPVSAERGAVTLEADDTTPRPVLALRLGAALVPLALGWFVAHDLTLLLFEGQNFRALVSDPIGEGWDLFGTFNDTIDYSIVDAAWVRWVQLLAMAAGHVAGVVIVHDTALGLLRRRSAMQVTWAFSAAAAASIAAGALLVLG